MTPGQMSRSEQRRYPRLATVARAVAWRGAQAEVFKLGNLSPGGAFVRCEASDIYIGEQMPMRIVTPNVCSVAVQAECVRLAGPGEPAGFAVRFSERQHLDPMLVESLRPS